MRRTQPKRLTRARARHDETYQRIIAAFCDRLAERGFVEKDEVLQLANATAWATQVKWGYILEFVTTEQPGVVIISLTWRYFASPRNKQAHSVEPSKYTAPNYTVAAGFGSVAQFVQLGERERDIALAKYSQQQIAAARAMEGAERFNAVITAAPPLALSP